MERRKLLVVDDQEMSREILRLIFEKEYDIVEACNGREGVDMAYKYMDELAAVLLDCYMPELDGFQVLRILDQKNYTDHVPIVIITAEHGNEAEYTSYSLGASAVITKPFIPETVKLQVENIIELHDRTNRLENETNEIQSELNEKKKQVLGFYNGLIDLVVNIVEFRHLESGEHVMRVRNMTRILANMYMTIFPRSGLTKDYIDKLVRAAALHDIGKIAIPDNVLLKPDKLTEEEYEIMKSHTTKGCDILNMMVNLQDKEQLSICLDVCHYHHERYDGKGYPEGISGDAIPLSAQLVALADCYDALCSARVYKKAIDKDAAFNMIMNGECGEFSPKVLECFSKARKELETFWED